MDEVSKTAASARWLVATLLASIINNTRWIMSLSCSCDFYPWDYETWWEDHSSFKPLVAKRRKRCCSCKELINIGTDVIEFYRYRNPRNDIEERIHGETVSIASRFMCEECSGLYLALDELGYGCLDISTNMREYINEYNYMREEVTTPSNG